MKLGSIQKQLAWQSAFELRGCPPESLLFGNQQSPELAAHINLCRFCKDKLASASDEIIHWSKLADNLLKTPIYHASITVPAPGQIWSLPRSLSGWGSANLHYNPPRVLLLEPARENDCLLRVAQTYTAAELMGSDDIWLSEQYGFAEIWNAYAIHKKDLDSCWGTLDDNTLKKVLSVWRIIGNNSARHHDQPVKIGQASILGQFRKLEAEVGAYCAAKSTASEGIISNVLSLTPAPKIPSFTVPACTDWEKLNERVRAIAAYWEPDWVGLQATAADTPEQKNTFRLEDGEIRVACNWRSGYGNKPAYVHVHWNADICDSGELWLVFIKPGSETILAEICLGDRYEGEEVFSSRDLGFDPSCEKWAMSIYLKEKQP